MSFEFMYHEEFWKDMLGRTLYTMAEALAGCLTGATIFDIAWKPCLAIVLTAGVTTALKCFIVACKSTEYTDTAGTYDDLIIDSVADEEEEE